MCLVCLFPAILSAQKNAALPLFLDKEGHLSYHTDALGNRIPDFSYCGYMASEQPIPDAPIKVVVPVSDDDATHQIQAALNYVATLPANAQGIRGAVLLEKGIYPVSGSLIFKNSGVILRGSGMNQGGTVLLGRSEDRQTLIRIAGKDETYFGDTLNIEDAYVPVNAMRFRLTSTLGLNVGDQIRIIRPSTKKWIEALKMSEFGGETSWLGWKPGERDLFWDRTITQVSENIITIDAPITTALDTTYGGGYVTKISSTGNIQQVGVENLRLVSTYDENNPKDEAHRWMAITLENVQDAWVRQVTFEHFAGSAVAIWESGRRITIEDCLSLHPVGELGGQRRYIFWTEGQQTLFQRLYAEHGYHDFVAGFRAGLNAFVQCKSYLSHSFSGAMDSWASGILFDNVHVDGNALSFLNRGQDAQGAGWTAANSMFWQCSAASIDCYRPPTAQNWAFGVWAQFAGDGYWHEANSHIQPQSLFYAQLSERLGRDMTHRAQLLPMETEATSSPTVAQADELTQLSKDPAPQLKDWISQAGIRNKVPVNPAQAKTMSQLDIEVQDPEMEKESSPLVMRNGWLIENGKVLTGKQRNVSWWRGNIRYYDRKKAQPHITRFVPGRIGRGLTDDLQEVADWMHKNNIVALDHNYGLWYDRRRDDHERVRRMDGEVWAPFYELPFARSGEGQAWDGLSKYDLTQYNEWYWKRLNQFASLAGQQGLVLLHQNYFQHNLLEAGAHWADFPWRTANNINETGFPEPPPYAGDKRIFMDEQFYDVSHPERGALHQAYIRQCLDNFAGNTNVIQFIGAEFTGPLHFVQFWLDTIREWEEATGQDAQVALSVTKDVQDSILADEKRADILDIIDIRYWYYEKDGNLYAPKGGQHLAPRQHARLLKPKGSSFAQTYRAVREYRQAYPDKAVMYSAGGDNDPWAVFMAGGSLAAIPLTSNEFLASAATMHPVASSLHKNQWRLTNDQHEFIIYDDSQQPICIDLQDSQSRYSLQWINPRDGSFLGEKETVAGGQQLEADRPQSGPVILWVIKESNEHGKASDHRSGSNQKLTIKNNTT